MMQKVRRHLKQLQKCHFRGVFSLKTTELYYPQVTAHVGPYSFTQGIEVEIHSAKTSYFDWAKIRFTQQYKPKISLNP